MIRTLVQGTRDVKAATELEPKTSLGSDVNLDRHANVTISGEYGQGSGRLEDLADGRDASAAARTSTGGASDLSHGLGARQRVSADAVVVDGAAVANEHGRRVGLRTPYSYQIENDIQYQPGPKDQKSAYGVDSQVFAGLRGPNPVAGTGGNGWRRVLEFRCMYEVASRSWQSLAPSACAPRAW